VYSYVKTYILWEAASTCHIRSELDRKKKVPKNIADLVFYDIVAVSKPHKQPEILSFYLNVSQTLNTIAE